MKRKKTTMKRLTFEEYATKRLLRKEKSVRRWVAKYMIELERRTV